MPNVAIPGAYIRNRLMCSAIGIPENSRAILWTLAPPALICLLLRIPQSSEILHPEWVMDECSAFWYVAAVCLGVLQWLLMIRYIVHVDYVLRLPRSRRDRTLSKLRTRASSRLRSSIWLVWLRLDEIVVWLFTYVMLSTITIRFRSTAIVLAAAGMGCMFVFAPLTIMALLSNNHQNYCFLTLYLLLSFITYIGAILSVSHIAFSNSTHWAGFVMLLPILLLYLGLFAIDTTARILTKATFMLLLTLPFIVIQRRDGAPTGKGSAGRYLWIGASLAISWLIIWRWNWSDQIGYAHEEERSVQPVKTHKPNGFVRLEISEMGGTGTIQFPPVFLNLGGGGSRAAIFNAGILSQLWWMRITLPSLTHDDRVVLNSLPDDLRETLVMGQHFYPGRLILIGNRFSSSVSGGTLALAKLQRDTMLAAQDIESINPRVRLSPIVLRARALDLTFHRYAGFESNWLSGGRIRRSTAFTDTFKRSDTAKDREKRIEEIEADQFLRAMSRNYLAVVIMGLFSTESSRSQNIRTAFNDYCFTDKKDQLRGHRLSDFFYAEAQGHVPYAMYNATCTTTGERVAVTNLSELWFRGMDSFGPSDTYELPPVASIRRFRARPGHVVPHFLLDPKWNPDLATATWVSSDFPFGFPVNRIRIDQPGDRLDRIVGTIDGGLTDNLGVNTTMSVIRALGSSAEDVGADKKIFDRFLIFDIDTSEAPFDPSPPGEFAYHLVEAQNALQRSKLANEQATWALYLRELDQKFRVSVNPDAPFSLPASPETVVSTLEGQVIDVNRALGSTPGFRYNVGFRSDRWSWYRVRCGELRDEHVSTSWHLPKCDRVRIFEMSLREDVRETMIRAGRGYLRLIRSASPSVKWDLNAQSRVRTSP